MNIKVQFTIVKLLLDIYHPEMFCFQKKQCTFAQPRQKLMLDARESLCRAQASPWRRRVAQATPWIGFQARRSGVQWGMTFATSTAAECIFSAYRRLNRIMVWAKSGAEKYIVWQQNETDITLKLKII